MRTFFCILFALAAAMTVPRPCTAQEPARRFLAALEDYKSGDYAAAAKTLEAIAADGVQNGQLYYDIGNAHLKNNDLGRAILWYERALKRIPNDPDLRFNYDYARSLTKDAQEENTISLVRILFFWKYQLSAGATIMLALIFNLLFWLLAALWRLTRRRGPRNAALAILLPMIVFILTAGYNYYEAVHRPHAIVLPGKVAVRAGLEPTATELFELHAGAKVTVVRRMKNHVQIQYSEDKIGWVRTEAVERI